MIRYVNRYSLSWKASFGLLNSLQGNYPKDIMGNGDKDLWYLNVYHYLEIIAKKIESTLKCLSGEMVSEA